MPGQMAPIDYSIFLPSFWISSLGNAPLFSPLYEIIELDENFINFLESDGMYIDDDTIVSSFSSEDEEKYDKLTCGDANEAQNDCLIPSKAFPAIHDKIIISIKELGGYVVPKINWTVPKDSIWISANTLKCTSSSEIYQLLKASDKIQADLNLCKSLKIVPQLFLRPFVEIETEYEFRCFVINKALIAVSQRNLDIFGISIKTQSKTILKAITTFYDSYMLRFDCSNYCFDIYYSYKSDKVHIIDINPLTSSSSTCLFTFSELMEHAQTYLSTSTLFKCIENNDDTIIKNLDRNFLPIDLLNANLDVSTIDFNNLS